MPKKKSIKHCAAAFRDNVDSLSQFLTAAQSNLSDQHISWAYELGVVRLYREFESLILDVLVGAVNNDTGTISSRTGIAFPKHLTDEVCEYLIIGDGFFDFKGRDGLIKTVKEYVPDDHYLVNIIKKQKYKDPIARLSALRNWAAHNSQIAKSRAKTAVGQVKMPEAGAWLKKQQRLETILVSLRQLSEEIEANAPY